jgi:hypothetical protein
MSGFDLTPLECVKVARSEHGRSVVVSDTQWESVNNSTDVIKPTRVTFRIFGELGNYSVGKLNAPMTFWRDSPMWTVTLDGDRDEDCPIPLLSDGAEYLVLLSQTGFLLTPQRIVMRIYKKPSWTAPEGEQGRGVPVKELTLKDLLPGRQISQNVGGERTPEWFEEGAFNWGRDNHSLLFKSGSGDSVSIDLLTGSVIDCNKQSVYACTGY